VSKNKTVLQIKMTQTRKVKTVTAKHDYIVVIPSYKRENTIQTKTLATLKHYKIPANKITIFVANDEQYETYKQSIPKSEYNELIIGVPGLAPVRNFILDKYPIGTKIVMIDDDVTGFVERTDNGKLRPLQSLVEVINTGFTSAEKEGASLWGVYPVANGFFMKPSVSNDLKFIIGSFWGIINPGATKKDGIELPMSEKEDYIRSLMCFDRDGTVVRINYVSPKTAYYKEPGGMQTDPKRLENQKKAVEYIMETWPDKVMVNNRRKSDYPEILLRRMKKIVN
jgi:cellulose synthase/poly-beta-1,6-N-acetylglucosamine synthase-like glycosyltransferase